MVEKERENDRLKLSTILNQMNPHFSHNVLNSIGALVYSKEPDEVYNQLTRFSRMMRSLLMEKNRILIPLKQELEFVSNYLELEKLRFEDRFKYSLPDINDTNINLLIQIPVENAIKHGLLPKSTPGTLKVSVIQNKEGYKITIIDNGIGRKEAGNHKLRNTEKGLKIMDLTAFTLCKENNMPIYVFDMNTKGNLLRIVKGEHLGTIVK